MTKAELQERFEFRDVRAEEADQTIAIENICFPPNEACSSKSMTERASQAQETFLVAVDKETGKIAGFLNGIATDEEVFRDEFFTDIRLQYKREKYYDTWTGCPARVSRTRTGPGDHGAISETGEGVRTQACGTYLSG